MSRKKEKISANEPNGVINNAGVIIEQNIVQTVEKNYMPYAMSVILSRALPEIDGFKPSHRKLLFTMYKMGLLNSHRTKSANIVGQTMKLNPHGDSAIYDTMVRLSRGYEALLHPFVDSKGNFGKFYSRDMACAASRYTEARLDGICAELFNDIEKNTVDFTDNYDNTLKEPSLLPASFPTILTNANTGIAVGMASSICSFNLKEVCETTISLLKNPEDNVVTTLIVPDFSGGGEIIYEKEKFAEIYNTGRGGFKVRAQYSYDKKENCVDITHIPPTTTIEAIIEKVIELVKINKIREITAIRDETGLNGLKITIDLKRGIDPEKFMAKLFKLTPLEDTFSCNFNILIDGTPKVLGIKEILTQWINFRIDCVKRRTEFDLAKKTHKLHLLEALKKILLNIDKAVEIIRKTEYDAKVIPNLMNGFEIDKIQAEFIAEIKLRALNREYILNRISEINTLESEIENLKSIINNKNKIKNLIIAELKNVINKYSQPRKSKIVHYSQEDETEEVEIIPSYPVTFFLTKEGYLKKITAQSLRMSGEQKLKENDEISQIVEGNNSWDLLFFTNKNQVYKAKGSSFADSKASVLGEFVASIVGLESDENVVYMAVTSDYSGFMIFAFADGKVAKIDMKSYVTKTNRKKLIKAYSDKSLLINAIYLSNDEDILLNSSNEKALIFNTSKISTKTSKNTQGITVMKLKKGHKIIKAMVCNDEIMSNINKYACKNIPSAGVKFLREDVEGTQLRLTS